MFSNLRCMIATISYSKLLHTSIWGFPKNKNFNAIHSSACLQLFWERDMKGGYKSKGPKPSKIDLIRDGLKEIKGEIQLWQKEVREKFESDPVIICMPGEVEILWQFKTPESMSKWVTTSDRDFDQGYSKCELVTSPSGNGLFRGTLDTRVPKDGKIKKAGFCNMKSHRARKSFKRDTYLDWTIYNHLVMRLRGDGRSYLINIATSGYYDVLWNDVYHYVIFTRGGPYWQEVKIPFSKFFLSSKGRVQDKQAPINLGKVTSLGISAGDKINGPFSLEIDYIGLGFDPTHTEEFAYETYQMKRYIVAT